MIFLNFTYLDALVMIYVEVRRLISSKEDDRYYIQYIDAVPNLFKYKNVFEGFFES
jgi:hypothetical protein